MSQPASMRLFLGIPIPDAHAQPLSNWCQQQASSEGIKWVDPALWHITVYFFGQVPNERYDNLLALLHLGLQQQAQLSLHFDRLALAPKVKEARMIWARFHKADSFRLLVQKLHRLYQQIDPNLQIRRSPIPHLTLARLKTPSAAHLIDLKQPPALPILNASQLILWQSTLTPAGPSYTVKAVFPLI